MNGKTAYEYLLEACGEKVGAEVDAGWMYCGGVDPEEFLWAHADRVKAVHYKDMKITGQEAPLGKGMVDLKACFQFARANGALQIVDMDAATLEDTCRAGKMLSGWTGDRDNTDSILCTMDVETGEETVLHEFPGIIEAPNWLNDGNTLLYNADGKIYRYEIDKDHVEQVDTGFCVQCNNDHVPSPDNQLLAVSCMPPELTDGTYESHIYVLPMTGGEPKDLTEQCGVIYLSHKDTKTSHLKGEINMSKKQIKKIIFMGVGCALLLIVGTIYSLLYNDGRWVKNMDMSEYVFSYKDIPMLVIGALIALYAIYIVIICFKNVFSKNSREKRYSRTISPYWGFCGMFGFLGFGGFWTYYKFGEIFPFAFFIFFGFFSFFFEGKLSHILEDELFQENKRKAQLEAYKIGFKLLFVVIWLMAIGMFSRNVEWCAIFMLISVSLIYALVLFLSNYLLYRYEKRE